MGNFITSAFGVISVEEKAGKIYVGGLRTWVMQEDIARLYNTTRVNLNLFNHIGVHSFSFKSFFALDFLCIIDNLLNDRKSRTSKKSLLTIREKLLTETWLRCMNKPFVSKLDKSKFKNLKFVPLDFQSEFFDIYDINTQKFELKGYLFAGAPGSGKTFSSLCLAECLNSEQVIVVSPANALRNVWENSVRDLFVKGKSYWLSSSNVPFTGKEEYLICSYEYLSKLVNDLRFIDRTKKITIILDESHNFGEASSQRVNNLVELCEYVNSDNVIWLSGTPVKAIALELVTLFRCFDPRFDDDVLDRFKKIYRGDKNKAFSILRERLGNVMFVVPKTRLNIAEPENHYEKVSFKGAEKFTLTNIKQLMQNFIQERVEFYNSTKKEDHEFFYSVLNKHESTLDRAGRAAFDSYMEDLKIVIKYGDWNAKDQMGRCTTYENTKIIPQLSNEDKIKFKDKRSVVKYVHLKIQGECLGRVVGRARIDCHVEMSKHIDYEKIIESTEKKTLVFTAFTDVLKATSEELSKREFTPLVVYADTNKNLSEIISLFEREEKYNPLVATYASLSTAVPMVMADTMIIIDSPFRDYILTQTIARIARIGATTQTHVYYHTLDTGVEPNISSRTLDILKWSQEQVEAITGIKSGTEVPEGSIKALESIMDDDTKAMFDYLKKKNINLD